MQLVNLPPERLELPDLLFTYQIVPYLNAPVVIYRAESTFRRKSELQVQVPTTIPTTSSSFPHN